MKQHPELLGLVLALGAFVGSSVYVYPQVAGLQSWFSWAGVFAGSLFGGIVFLLVFISIFYVAHRVGAKTSLPEVAPA